MSPLLSWVDCTYLSLILILSFALHFIAGIVLGNWKEKSKQYSPIWIFMTFLAPVPLGTFCLQYTLPSYTVLTVMTCVIASVIGQVLGGACTAIGLTGGIATGKSTVAKVFRDHKIPIIDADEIARVIVTPGAPAHRNIVEAFGPDILLEDQSLNRKALGDIVFKDEAKRKVLNSCTHYYIVKEILIQLVTYRLLQQKKIVVLDAPLLYESRVLPLICYPVIVVACPEHVQIERLKERDASKVKTTEDAVNRIKAQMPLETKIKKCDLVIDNNDSVSLETLATRALVALEQASAMLNGNFKSEKVQQTTL